jgi:hypothetical protein
MGLQVDPPFGLGQTWFSLGSGESIKNDSYHGIQSSASYGDNFVGVVKEFTDVNPVTGQVRSNRRKVCIAVKNTATIALAPKRVVAFNTAAGKLFTEVNGYSASLNEERIGVVDEWLPAAGVTVNDIFWVTVNGPTEVSAALSGTAITAGTRLAAITAAASTGTTAGRATPSALTGSTTGQANDNGRGVIGYAISAGTTADGSAVLALITTPIA